MSIRSPGRGRLAAAALLAMALPLSSQSQEVPAADAAANDDPALQTSEIMPRAPRSLLLDAARVDGVSLLVGERGHVLSSTDGQAWTQAQVPTRSTLTAISAVDGHLWAAGHDGVIIHSADGGKTWERQRATPWVPGSMDFTLGVPVMDLLFSDASNGIAVGSYSLMLVTRDGGATWTPRNAMETALDDEPAPDAPIEPEADEASTEGDNDWTFSDADLELDAESDPHFNAITRTGSGALVIAGERGAFLRSRDNGRNWEAAPLPYEGSMFGVLAWEEDHVLVFGLRGNVFESRDLGTSWIEVQTGISDSLMGGIALANGGALLVGANGAVLYRPDADSPFQASAFETEDGETPVLASAVALDDGSFLLVGDKGVNTYRPE